jgi:hypothetical protein
MIGFLGEFGKGGFFFNRRTLGGLEWLNLDQAKEGLRVRGQGLRGGGQGARV